MAFLRIQRKGASRYYAVVRNDRCRGKVVQRVLEWLGRDPDAVRLRRALRYWRVGTTKRADWRA